MNPVVELAYNSDQHFSNLGKLEFLLNYDKVLDVEIQSLRSGLKDQQQDLENLQKDLNQQEKLLAQVLAFEKNLNSTLLSQEEPEPNVLRKSVHEVDALAWARCEINVPDLSHYSEFIRQLENEHVLERMENNRRRTLDQLKKLMRTLEEVTIQARSVDVSLQHFNQQRDRSFTNGGGLSDQ